MLAAAAGGGRRAHRRQVEDARSPHLCAHAVLSRAAAQVDEASTTYARGWEGDDREDRYHEDHFHRDRPGKRYRLDSADEPYQPDSADERCVSVPSWQFCTTKLYACQGLRGQPHNSPPYSPMAAGHHPCAHAHC